MPNQPYISYTFGPFDAAAELEAVDTRKHIVPRNHTFQFITTGAPVTATMQFEGSNDGSTWAALTGGGDVDVSSSGVLAVDEEHYSFIRCRLSALSGGTAPTVTVYYIGV